MSQENVQHCTAPTRRAVLKKAGIASAFIVPVITTYTISDLAQAASPAIGSGPPAPPSPTGP